MKMCEQIFKKKTAPQYNSSSLNCKNIAGQILLKESSLSKQKLDLWRTTRELGNDF